MLNASMGQDTHTAIRVRWASNGDKNFSLLGTFTSLDQAISSLVDFSINEDLAVGDAAILCDLNDVSDLENKATNVYFVSKNKSIVDISKIPKEIGITRLGRPIGGWFSSYEAAYPGRIANLYLSLSEDKKTVRLIAHSILSPMLNDPKINGYILSVIDRACTAFELDYMTISADEITSEMMEAVRWANDSVVDEDFLIAAIYGFASYIITGDFNYFLDGFLYLRDTDKYDSADAAARDIIPLNLIMSVYAEKVKS